MSRSIWSIFERTSANASGARVGAGFDAALPLPFALAGALSLAGSAFFGAFLLDLLLAIGVPCCGARTRRCAPFIAQP
ncbi:hypothetical protein G6F31_019062 [Rhizopus arrhizus]|nr:hypothetical protein G6F31_019062 [Rhizopus arrhizus]